MTQITIIKAERNKAPKGNYQITEVAYRTEDGKTKGMKIYPFEAQKEIAEAFNGAQEGDMYNVQFQKNDRDFWEFKSVEKLGVKQATGGAVSKQQWVPDEDKQRMIVSQNSVTNGVNFVLGTKGVKATMKDVLEAAAEFREFVYAKPTKDAE